jgi:hypothetical protein
MQDGCTSFLFSPHRLGRNISPHMPAPHVSMMAPTSPAGVAGRLSRRPLYVGLSVLMAAIAIVGFWVTYFGPLAGGVSGHSMLIHVHAAVFVGWLALFLVQALLAASRRVKAHVALGRIGIGYGVLLVFVGVWTTISRSAEHMRSGGPGEGLLFVALLDMVIFAPLFATAIAYRRRPQVHKRLMVVAATMLLVAAVGRFWFIPAPPLDLLVSSAIWFSPVLLAMTHDWMTARRVHPVYLIGLGVFVVRLVSPGFVVGTAAWSSTARFIMSLAG